MTEAVTEPILQTHDSLIRRLTYDSLHHIDPVVRDSYIAAANLAGESAEGSEVELGMSIARLSRTDALDPIIYELSDHLVAVLLRHYQNPDTIQTPTPQIRSIVDETVKAVLSNVVRTAAVVIIANLLDLQYLEEGPA